MRYRIVASLIAKDQAELESRIARVKGIAGTMQLDVMDGDFVKAKSLDFNMRTPRASFESHLMVKDPEKWIDRVKNAGMIIAHIESCRNPESFIRSVRKKKKKVGFALNPGTPIAKVKPYLNMIDLVLVMTVKPGRYGAKFIPATLKKVAALRRLSPEIDIEVDGGIDDRTIGLAVDAGANVFVSGSYVMKSRSPKRALAVLEKEVKSHAKARAA